MNTHDIDIELPPLPEWMDWPVTVSEMSAAEVKDAMQDYARAAIEAVLQSPEVQAWKRDAERYGKLVSAWFDDDHSGDFILMNNMPPDAYQSKADIDEDIDAMHTTLSNHINAA